MLKLEPTEADLGDPECAALFLTLRSIKSEQQKHGAGLAVAFPTLDYLSCKKWAARYAELREQEKRIRMRIFGHRRRYATDRRRNATPALDAAIEALSCASAPAGGSGAPTPQTSDGNPPALRLCPDAPPSSPGSPTPEDQASPAPKPSRKRPIGVDSTS